MLHVNYLSTQWYHNYYTQVCPPGLHLTLGIFYRLFSLMETACHRLDLEVTKEDSRDEGGISYGYHLDALSKLDMLKPQLDR